MIIVFDWDYIAIKIVNNNKKLYNICSVNDNKVNKQINIKRCMCSNVDLYISNMFY